MANGDGKGMTSWTIVVPMSALALLGSLMFMVSKDSAIALDIANRQAERLLYLQAELTVIQSDLRERTQKRYTSDDAFRDHGLMMERIKELETEAKTHIKEHDKR